MHKKNKQKNIYYAKMLSTNWLMIFIALMLIAIVIVGFYISNEISNQKSVTKNIQDQIDKIISSNTPSSEDSLLIQYYQELSNKTDEAISRILITVGLIAGIITLFSVLFAFKAPHDIDKRLDEIKKEIDTAKEAAAEAKYQAEIANALTKETEQKRIEDLSEVIEKYPNKHDAYAYRGIAKCYNKQYESARSDFEIAHKLGIEKYAYYNLMGYLLCDIEEYENAIICFSKSIEEKPDGYTAYGNRAYAYSEIGESEKALSDFKQALFLYPDFVSALINRGVLYSNLMYKEEDPDKRNELQSLADADYSKAKKLDPENEFFKGITRTLPTSL